MKETAYNLKVVTRNRVSRRSLFGNNFPDSIDNFAYSIDNSFDSIDKSRDSIDNPTNSIDKKMPSPLTRTWHVAINQYSLSIPLPLS
jgi:hypothetical protein